VQVFAAPIEGSLKDFTEFGETGFADNEQSSPHQRTHAAEKDTKLIDRNGRYGRVSHAGILPKPTGTVLSLPPESPALSII
jgi:hypothetical protein